jgi:hypothetical protein
MSNGDTWNLLDILSVTGLSIEAYLETDDYLSLERINRNFNFDCPEISLNSRQSVKLLNFLRNEPSEIFKRRLRRTSIKITASNKTFVAIRMVPIQNFCLLRCIILSSIKADLDVDHELFNILGKAKDQGLRIFTEDIDLPFAESLAIYRYLDCVDEISKVTVRKSSKFASLKCCLDNFFHKIKELSIETFDAEMFYLLMEKFHAVQDGGAYKPKITVDLTDSCLFKIHQEQQFETSSWVFLISVADSIHISCYGQRMLEKFRDWLQRNPEHRIKIVETVIMSLSDKEDANVFSEMLKPSLVCLSVSKIKADLRSFPKLQRIGISQLPDDLLFPKCLYRLALGKMQEFDFLKIKDLIGIKEIALESADAVKSSMDMRKFNKLESLYIHKASQIDLGCLPNSLRRLAILPDIDFEISTISITVNSSKIELTMGETRFNQILFTDQVKHVKIFASQISKIQIEFDETKKFNFQSLTIGLLQVDWLKILNPVNFPCLKKLEILGFLENDEKQYAQGKLLTLILQKMPGLEFLSCLMPTNGVCETIATAFPDASVVISGNIVEVERK